MIFHLSKRQLKELANGKQLRIALPHPADDPPDCLAWARELLDVDPSWIVAARGDSLPCVWSTAPGDVAQAIGEILRDQAHEPDPETTLIYYVEIVLCTLQSRKETRGSYPPQWPGTWSV